MRRILLIVPILFGASAAAGLPAKAAAPVPPVGSQDMVLGSAKAPVTVIEYASLTCPHCARWEKDVFPKVKAQLIDTGKIRYVFRDFPLDGAAVKAAQLAHCDPSKYFGFVAELFDSQAAWARTADPTDDLVKIAKLADIPSDKAEACLSDQSLANNIILSREKASQAGVDATPTFFFNGGKMHAGEMSYSDFAQLVHDAGS